ncbi:hypothetical protein FHG66_05245 [Rubellimicrobium rubrum]|uniref:Flagellar export protein FliJ n=1 Tax=Rubellimicrobium rubrum TaxID=2585369 RepID=A0A5C4N2B0_9RHOB|nr:hypothetical protein [Rubellimicrobium rubrum]TNC51569.1 hypothetical protein FHG66_05245 [Rubellimicrobium rubrum]
MREKDLAPLVRLAGVSCDAAEARLASLRREEAELRRQIEALETARRLRASEALATDVALRAGADLRWEGWIDKRASALNGELARVLAKIEMARDDLARAFGRRSATQALLDQARDVATARRHRTEERGW